jgi:hypothetical protein
MPQMLEDPDHHFTLHHGSNESRRGTLHPQKWRSFFLIFYQEF